MLDDQYRVTYICVCDECGVVAEEQETADLPDGWIPITHKYIMCPECVAE